MDRDLCFILNGISVYNDFCLIRDDIPIFFTCKDEYEKYYVALCVDMDLPRYNVVKVTIIELNNMLQGIISMRKIFTIQQKYWEVTPMDEKIENDKVIIKSMTDMKLEDLPDEGAYFELFSEELDEYAKSINIKIMQGEFVTLAIDTDKILNDINNNFTVDFLIYSDEVPVPIEVCLDLEFEKKLILQSAVLSKYKEEESCVIKDIAYTVKNQNIIANKILIKDICEASFLCAA